MTVRAIEGAVRWYWWVAPEDIPGMEAKGWQLARNRVSCLHHRYRWLMVREG